MDFLTDLWAWVRPVLTVLGAASLVIVLLGRFAKKGLESWLQHQFDVALENKRSQFAWNLDIKQRVASDLADVLRIVTTANLFPSSLPTLTTREQADTDIKLWRVPYWTLAAIAPSELIRALTEYTDPRGTIEDEREIICLARKWLLGKNDPITPDQLLTDSRYQQGKSRRSTG